MANAADLTPLVDAEALIRAAWAFGLEPDAMLLAWEWAERERKLPEKGANEAGPYRISRVPFLREPHEVMSAGSPVQRVTVVKGSQGGWTEFANNIIGYYMDAAPCPIMLAEPTLELGERVSRQRIAPMIQDSPSLRRKLRAASRDSGDRALLKEFPGGMLVIVGSNSAAAYRQMPARVVIGDDIDAFEHEAGEEGDPIFLLERATMTFGVRRKILKISTPTIEGRSRILDAWEDSDQRFYHVPCLHCGDYSPIAWKANSSFVVGARKHIWWPDDPKLNETERGELVRMVCEVCGGHSPEHFKERMLAEGRWVPTHPQRSTIHRGYHHSTLYSPLGWSSWGENVELFLKGTRNQAALRHFVNQRLGEGWREKGDAPDWKRLYNLRERYPEWTVPARACVLTAGVDCQGDRLEVLLRAWGPGMESWGVGYRVIAGGPSDESAWRELDELLSTPLPHASGSLMQVRKLAIDAGYGTQDVYAWVRRQDRRRVMAVLGRAGTSTLLSTPQRVEVVGRTGKRFSRGVERWIVGVDEAKGQIYSWLRQDPPTNEHEGFPAGYMHHPQWGESYFRQTCAEQVVVRIIRGVRRYVWELIGERNEGLDVNVYNLGAATALGLQRWGPERWRAEFEALGSAAPPRRRGEDPPSAAPPAKPSPPSPGPQGGGWLGGRGTGSKWLRR